jgi:hypothetical protein
MEENDMKSQKAFTRVLGIFALLLCTLILSVSNSAAQVTGPVVPGNVPFIQGPVPEVNGPEGGGPVPGGPGFVILSGFDFKPFYQTSNYSYTNALLQNPGSGMGIYIAPVHLPQGATVNQMVVYYLDNDGSNNLQVELRQCNNMTSLCAYMATIYSSGPPLVGNTYTVTSEIDYAVVDNAIFSYMVNIYLPNSGLMGLSAVRIDYTYTTSLPTVIR